MLHRRWTDFHHYIFFHRACVHYVRYVEMQSWCWARQIDNSTATWAVSMPLRLCVRSCYVSEWRFPFGFYWRFSWAMWMSVYCVVCIRYQQPAKSVSHTRYIGLIVSRNTSAQWATGLALRFISSLHMATMHTFLQRVIVIPGLYNISIPIPIPIQSLFLVIFCRRFHSPFPSLVQCVHFSRRSPLILTSYCTSTMYIFLRLFCCCFGWKIARAGKASINLLYLLPQCYIMYWRSLKRSPPPHTPTHTRTKALNDWYVLTHTHQDFWAVKKLYYRYFLRFIQVCAHFARIWGEFGRVSMSVNEN